MKQWSSKSLSRARALSRFRFSVSLLSLSLSLSHSLPKINIPNPGKCARARTGEAYCGRLCSCQDTHRLHAVFVYFQDLVHLSQKIRKLLIEAWLEFVRVLMSAKEFLERVKMMTLLLHTAPAICLRGGVGFPETGSKNIFSTWGLNLSSILPALEPSVSLRYQMHTA